MKEGNIYEQFSFSRTIKISSKSPTAFHAVQQMKSELLAVDFTELKENQRWNIECGKHYFVTRNDSSLIAFTIPENGIDKMHILTSHSDSPTFKIKENPEIEVEKHYVKLNVENMVACSVHPGLTVRSLLPDAL